MKKKKPKLIVEFVQNETVNFPEFIDEVLGYIKNGKISKKEAEKLKVEDNQNQKQKKVKYGRKFAIQNS